ncbi:hypothetical protein BK816_00360 [Boudabousia tangfeifanii]|uniref:ABC3 transporter permease C-terminal domain-containing protein n=1 Tax=Boudabousia tangfeifanii TaxID=1912795 RepID=A0A1D9MHZ1_9ACTO|nr:ABC transporter permease [Boudabousia tangfeifanii]AOZ71931.1 hypothetical protein BK816_00360 [Boudabousia tangfeifanii]
MNDFIRNSIRHDWRRLLAVFVAVFLAVPSFLLLTSSVNKNRLEVGETIQQNWRGSFDLLLRPTGSRTDLETQQNLVTPNFLNHIYGGITMEQLSQVRSLGLVEVAAPVATIGYLPINLLPSIDITQQLPPSQRQLVRYTTTLTANQGAKREIPAGPFYTYFTPQPLDTNGELCEETLTEGEPARLSPWGYQNLPIFVMGHRAEAEKQISPCTNQFPGHNELISNLLEVPLGITAIDPKAEAQLVNLNQAIVTGRNLRPSDGASEVSVSADFRRLDPGATPENGNGNKGQGAENPGFTVAFTRKNVLPILLSNHLGPVDLNVNTKVESLGTDLADRFVKNTQAPNTDPTQNPLAETITQAPAENSQNYQYTFQDIWQNTIAAIVSSWPETPADQIEAATFKRRVREPLIAVNKLVRTGTLPLTAEGTDWKVTPQGSGQKYNSDETQIVPSDHDENYREITEIALPTDESRTIDFMPVGIFDPNKLAASPNDKTNTEPNTQGGTGTTEGGEPTPTAGQNPASLSPTPLGTYRTELPVGADQASRDALGNQPLQPNLNPTGYLSTPPAILTTLDGMVSLLQKTKPELAKAPISAIRVRVKDIDQYSPENIEKLRVVGEQIQNLTGLEVDIMAGGSPSPQTIKLPANGKLPALTLTENWTKKGTSTQIVKAIDQKSLVIFALILLSALLTTTIAASALVGAKKHQIGVLLAIGWTSSSIRRALIAEVTTVGALAGLLGLGITYLLGAFLKLGWPWYQPLLTLPIAILVTVVAAWLGTRKLSQQTPREALAS